MTRKVLPADSELVRMRDQGMTHQQIADEITRRTGQRVARSTVSVALHRAGEQTVRRIRYKKEVPWVVPTTYATEYPVRMLRALGRRNNNLPMLESEKERLQAWLDELADRGLIVAYCPNPPKGKEAFYYIPAAAKDHNDKTPIRREPVTATQIGF